MFSVPNTLNSSDLFLCDTLDSRDTRPLGPSVDQDSARTALTFSTSILGPNQIKVLAQYSEKAGLGIRVDGVATLVNSEADRSHCVRDPSQEFKTVFLNDIPDWELQGDHNINPSGKETAH